MKLSPVLLCSALSVAAAKAGPLFARGVAKNTRKNRQTARLLEKSKAVRKRNLDQHDEDALDQLDEDALDQPDEDDLDRQGDEELDLANYSIKFEKCQHAQRPGGSEDGGEDVATKRFVIFRLCPDSSCGSCSYDYEEYIVTMEEYLEVALEFKGKQQEQYCETCNRCHELEQEDGGEDDEAMRCNNMDTASCYMECQNIENMEANGYVDASEFVECQELNYEDNNNDSNGTEVKYYAGATCAGSGSRIKIGVFLDEDCSVYAESQDVEDYLKNDDGYAMKLSYHLLKQTFVEGYCVASCLRDDDDSEEPETVDVCENLLAASGRCESSRGFDDDLETEPGIVDYHDYAAQVLCHTLDE